MLPIQPLLMRNETTTSGTNFGALVRKSGADQTFGGTAAALTFDTEVYDAGGWHSPSATAALTVLAGTSLVRVSSNFHEPGTTNNKIQHRLGGSTFRGMGLGDGTAVNNIVSAPIAVSSGNYFETWYNRETAGSSSPTNDKDTWFAIEKLDPATKYALVYHNASQALAASTTTILSFNSEVADTNGFHDTATNNSRLTVPSGVTLVRLVANGVGGNVTGQFNLFLNKNGATFRGRPNRDNDTTGDDNINIVSPPLVVTPGDYFELGAFPDTATSVPTGDHIWFSIEEVPSTYKRALVYKTGNQTFTAATPTVCTWDAEEYDTDGLHDNVTNNSRLTVPSGCTKARPTFNIRTSSVAQTVRAWVTKNGVDYYGMPAFDCATTGTDNLNAMGAWVDVTPGDYFECRFVSDVGCTVGNDNETWFCLECQ